ncbi:hypothetical protein FQR65_LT05667 [Abscondita terminalis]|nr:hypothetical protein FQR65_LT05667 [Abscondita terminalis]
MHVAVVVCAFSLLIANSTAANTRIGSVLSASKERAEVVEALKNKDYVLALIKLIDLKFKVNPPEDYSPIKFWLLLAKKVLIKIHPYYLRIQKIGKLLFETRHTYSKKRREQILKILYVLKNMIDYVQGFINYLISRFGEDVVGIEYSNDNSEKVEGSTLDESNLIVSTLGLFDQLASSILGAASAIINDLNEMELEDSNRSSSKVSKRNTIVLPQNEEYQNRTRDLQIQIVATITVCYLQV